MQLNRSAGESAGNDGIVFSPDESVELIGESLSPAELVNIWEIAKAFQQPSVSYVARGVLIDSMMEVSPAGELVQTRSFEMALTSQ